MALGINNYLRHSLLIPKLHEKYHVLSEEAFALCQGSLGLRLLIGLSMCIKLQKQNTESTFKDFPNVNV